MSAVGHAQWGRTTWTSLLNGGFNLPHLQLRAPFSCPRSSVLLPFQNY